MLIKFAIKNLFSRKRRSLISLTGISLSAALFVSTIFILKSAQSAFEKPIKNAGADIIVQLQGEPCGWSIVKLPRDINPIPIEAIDKIRSIDDVSSAEGALIVWAFSNPPNSQPAPIMHNNSQRILEDIKNGSLQGEPCNYGPPGSFCGTEGAGGMTNDFSPTVAVGINPQANELGPISANNIPNLTGRYFSKDDSYAAILDKDFARAKNLKVEDSFNLGQRVFKVIGTVDAGRDAKIAGAQAFIPLNTAIDMTGRGNIVDIIFVKLKPAANPDSAKEKIKKATSENATITSSNDFLNAISGLTNLTQGLMLAILFIAILFSILFIIKTSFGSILERSNEIGILKSIGWQDRQINKLIFIENLILGAIGGIAGSIAGYAASLIYKTNIPSMLPYYLNPYPPCSQHLAKNALEISIKFSTNIFIIVVLASISIQALSGFLASRKILSLTPADATRQTQ